MLRLTLVMCLLYDLSWQRDPDYRTFLRISSCYLHSFLIIYDLLVYIDLYILVLH